MNRFILLIGLNLFVRSIFAQEMIVPEKRIYVSPQGKMYINKSLPLYMKLTYNPQDSGVTLIGEKSKPNTLPIYLQNEGLNTFRTPSAVDKNTRKIIFPKQDIVFEVYADSKSPVSILEIDPSKHAILRGTTFLSPGAVVKLSSVDETSGVEQILYSIDSVKFTPYSSPVTLDQEKEYLFRFYAYDYVGNVEKEKSFKMVVDKTPPVTKFEIKGENYNDVLSGNAKIQFKSSDYSSGLLKLNAILNGKPLVGFTGTLHTQSLSQGEHKLEFYAIDQVSNKEPVQTYNFYIDRTPPTILQEIVGKSFMSNGREYSSGRSQLKITTLDNKAGVKAIYYSINNGNYKLYEKPVLLGAIKGNVSIKAYAVDNVNNQSEVTDDASSVNLPYIDLSGPVLKHQLLGPQCFSCDTSYISSKTGIQLMGYDPDAGFNNIEYAVDRDKPVVFKGVFTIPQPGYHTVGYTGYDNVDNTSLNSFNVMVDNSGPEVYTQFSSPRKASVLFQDKTVDAYPHHVSLFVSATDVQAGFSHMTYSINNSTWKEFSGFINGFQKNNVVRIKAFDRLGNFTQAVIEFIVMD